MEIEGRRFVVVGLGVSGAAAARFLAGRGGAVTVADARKEDAFGDVLPPLRKLGVRAVLGGHPASLFDGVDAVVLSPGVPHTLPEIERVRAAGAPVVGEIELASRFIDAPVVAVSGTNGKTTTTALISRMLEASGFDIFTGGNIGDPLIGYLERSRPAEVVVAELSSFQLDTIENFRPRVAVLLNVTPDHQDRYPDMAAYLKSKARLFENQKPSDTAVISGLDARVRSLADRIPAKTLFFSGRGPGEDGVDVVDGVLRFRTPADDGASISLTGLALQGGHNQENAAAACLAARAAGATLDGVRRAVRDFRGLPHRMEYVGTKNGVRYFNDSKATNLDAVIRALETFDAPVVLIAGGRDKGTDFTLLGPALRGRVKRLVAMGEAGGLLRETLGGVAPVTVVPGMAEAVSEASRRAAPGEVVLLSPACASFDQYGSYARRGDHFRRLVGGLRGGGA